MGFRIGTSYRVITADLHRIAGIDQGDPYLTQARGSR
jgi:hypothetical protein